MIATKTVAPVWKRRLDHEEMGKRFRSARKGRGLKLAETAKQSGMSVASLSKAERGMMVLSYEKFVKLAQVLELDLGSLFDDPIGKLQAGSCIVTRSSNGVHFDAGQNTYEMLSTQLAGKQMAPAIMYVRSKTLDEFGDFNRHVGEEFAFVVQGEVDLHFEDGTVHHLSRHDSVYFDSEMGHLYLRRGSKEAIVLGVCMHSRATNGYDLIPSPQSAASTIAPQAAGKRHRAQATLTGKRSRLTQRQKTRQEN